MKLASPVKRRHTRIEIIPLIDIMFFLLASFMMVSLQMDRAQNIKVNLPSASMARADYKPDMINLAVDKAGAVWLEKKEITLPELGRSSATVSGWTPTFRSISAAMPPPCMARWWMYWRQCAAPACRRWPS